MTHEVAHGRRSQNALVPKLKRDKGRVGVDRWFGDHVHSFNESLPLTTISAAGILTVLQAGPISWIICWTSDWGRRCV